MSKILVIKLIIMLMIIVMKGSTNLFMHIKKMDA